MALAKVTLEALTRMANTLRQSADDILATKEQMDRELYSIPWDDPIGLAFIGRYEEDFKPLKEKLIPSIEDYIQYMNQEGMIVLEYSGESAGGLGISSAVGASAMGAGVTGASSTMAKGKTSAGLSGMRADTPIAQNKQTKEIGKDKPLTPVEEMDMDAVYAELSSGQKSAYDKLKKEILDRKEQELFKAKVWTDVLQKEAGIRGDGGAAAGFAIRAEYMHDKAISRAEEELKKLDDTAREAVRNMRNQKN